MKNRKIFLIIASVFFTIPIYAAEGIPGVFFVLPLGLVSLFLIIPVEWAMFKFVLFPKKEYKYFESVFAANIFSLLIGIPLTWILLVVLQLFLESKDMCFWMNQYLWITENISLKIPAISILVLSQISAFFLERLVYRKYIWNEKKVKLNLSIILINFISMVVSIVLIPFAAVVL